MNEELCNPNFISKVGIEQNFDVIYFELLVHCDDQCGDHRSFKETPKISFSMLRFC